MTASWQLLIWSARRAAGTPATTSRSRPSRAGWGTPPAGARRCRLVASPASPPAATRCSWYRCPVGRRSASTDETSRSPGGPTCSPAHRLRLPAAGHRRDDRVGATAGGSPCAAPATDAALPSRAGRPPTCRSSCAGPGSPAGWSATSRPPMPSSAGAIIACEVITPGGNWSRYPAHKHDEASGDRVGARGDLLLRDRRRPGRTSPGSGFHRTTSSPGRRDRRTASRCTTGHRAGAVRLARAVRRRARARHVLPERHGRARAEERAWLITDHPDQAWVRDTWADQADRPPTDAERTADERDGAARRSPRRPCGSWRRSTPSATASSSGCSPAASASSATATWPGWARRCCRPSSTEPDALPYVLGRNEQAMVHTAVAYARMKDRLQTYAVSTSVGPGRDQHGHRCRAGHHQPAAGAAAARRHVRRPQRLAAAPGARAARTPATSPSTTRSGRSRSTSTGSGVPSSCPPRCSRRCGCSPTRPRPARSRSASRRTCRPRRTTGRSSCSPSGSGTSPGRCRRPRCSRRPPS